MTPFDQWTSRMHRMYEVVVPGPGNRIEFIGPCLGEHIQPYNWAEGTLALQARREAGLARTRQFQRNEGDRLHRLMLLSLLNGQLDRLRE